MPPHTLTEARYYSTQIALVDMAEGRNPMQRSENCREGIERWPSGPRDNGDRPGNNFLGFSPNHRRQVEAVLLATNKRGANAAQAGNESASSTDQERENKRARNTPRGVPRYARGQFVYPDMAKDNAAPVEADLRRDAMQAAPLLEPLLGPS